MLIKEHIIKDIEGIKSPRTLHQLFEYLQVVKQSESLLQSNSAKVLKFAGTLTNAEARRITESVKSAFNQIEGEW
jgi:hypothetical protein